MSDSMQSAVLEFNSPAYLIQKHLQDHDYDLSVWDELDDDSYVKAVMSSAWFSGTGMTIPDSATDADLFVAMRASRAIHQSDAWVRGDIINWLRDHRYNGGDIPREDLVKFARELGVASAKRLLNNATTARAWPIDTRYPAHELTYSHHEELNKLPTLERMAWAQRARDESLSISALRQAIQDDVASISVDGESTVTEVSFASEKVDKAKVIAALALTIQVEAQKKTNGNVKLAAENILKSYSDLGLIRFPARAWSGMFGKAASTEEEEDA